VIHPLDQTRDNVRLMLLEIYQKCKLSKACDIIMGDYCIPAPHRCGDCTEEFQNGIRSSRTWNAMDGH